MNGDMYIIGDESAGRTDIPRLSDDLCVRRGGGGGTSVTGVTFMGLHSDCDLFFFFDFKLSLRKEQPLRIRRKSMTKTTRMLSESGSMSLLPGWGISHGNTCANYNQI